MRIFDEIKEKADKGENILCLFDMDGTCAEYGANEKKRILDNEKGFYFSKRPLVTILKIMENLSNINNVQVGILSNCYYEEQKEDKINWLKKYAPFIRDKNVNIIVLTKETYTKENKAFLKSEKIKKIEKENEEIYFFEDDHQIIRATLKALPHVNTRHISTLID